MFLLFLGFDEYQLLGYLLGVSTDLPGIRSKEISASVRAHAHRDSWESVSPDEGESRNGSPESLEPMEPIDPCSLTELLLARG